MKKEFSKYLIICLVIMGTLFGCGQDVLTEIPEASESEKPNTVSESLPLINDKNAFQIKDGVLIKYLGGFEREAEVILPPEVKKIGKKAFALTKEEKRKPVGQLGTLHLAISKHVALEKYAFTNMGPMIVTFEEGRTYIEKRAFFDSTRTGISSEVILPNSLTTLRKDCFRNNLAGSFLRIKLGNGLQIIEEGALYGVSVESLPDSIVHIGKEAFGEWGFLPEDLPEGVKSLDSHFIDITYGRIKIPSSVKKIAPDAVWWREDCENCGYDVAEDNPYFMSDSNGSLYSKDGKTLYYANKN